MGMRLMLLYVFLAIKLGCSRILEGITVDYNFNIEIIPESTNISNEQALGMLESFAASELSEALGKTSLAEFLGIQSSLIGQCNGFNDNSCISYLSSISINVQTQATEDAITRTTLAEAQRLVESFNTENPGVIVSFHGPFVVSTNILIRLWNAKRSMTESEVSMFETILFDVLTPLEDDATITKISVYFQQSKNSDRRLLLETNYNDVYIRAEGRCQSCTKSQFGFLTNDAIGARSTEIEDRLREAESNSGSQENYFEDVFVVPVAVGELKPEPLTKKSAMASEKGEKFPVYAIYGLVAGVGIILIGIGYVARKNRRVVRVEESSHLEKESYSQSKS